MPHNSLNELDSAIAPLLITFFSNPANAAGFWDENRRSAAASVVWDYCLQQGWVKPLKSCPVLPIFSNDPEEGISDQAWILLAEWILSHWRQSHATHNTPTL